MQTLEEKGSLKRVRCKRVRSETLFRLNHETYYERKKTKAFQAYTRLSALGTKGSQDKRLSALGTKPVLKLEKNAFSNVTTPNFYRFLLQIPFIKLNLLESYFFSTT